MLHYPQSLLSTPITISKKEGRDTICSGVAHKVTLSTNHVDERKLKSNVGHHDSTTKEAIKQHSGKLAKYRLLTVGIVVWPVDNSHTIDTLFIYCN